MKIAITADPSKIIATCRIIAKHLTALADELENGPPDPKPAEPEPEPAAARQELSCTSASTERRWSPHAAPPATPFGFGR
jgi:hypothetical protein